MAVTVAGVSTTAGWVGSSGLPMAVNWPGATAGQLIVLPVFARAAANSVALTSGYTLKSTDNATGTNTTGEIQAKIAGSSESAPSVSTGILDTQPTGAIAIVVDGWSGTLSDVVVTQDAGANSTPLCPAGTAPVDVCLVLRGLMVADNNALSSALTPVFNQVTDQGSDAAMGWWSETVNAGAVPTAAITMADADGWLSFTIVIPPAVVGEEVSVTAGCAEATGAAHDAVAGPAAEPAGPRIVSTTPRGRIVISTLPPITATSPRGWL